jgi:hypothetical protein
MKVKRSVLLRSPWVWLLLSLAVIAGLIAVGPAEKSLGVNVRVVYLHGAWVWTALALFIAAAVLGLAGLAGRRESLHRRSRAAGRAGLVFWISYLPLSIWAMQSNWNGLFLAEPRWRLAVIFAIGGLVLQLGLALVDEPAWASVGNILYAVTLLFALRNTQQIMHPASPILQSDSWRIQLFFFLLLLFCLLAAWQIARIFWTIDERRRMKDEGRKTNDERRTTAQHSNF